MPTNRRTFSITSGPSLLELCFSLFDEREGLFFQDSVVFQAESNKSESDDMPPWTHGFRCCMKSLHRLNNGNHLWRFKAIVISLDVKKEVQGEYNCQTRKGTIKSLSEEISGRDYKLSDNLCENMQVVVGPDKYELASALVRGDYLNQRAIKFQLRGNESTDIYGWDARIIGVERIDFSNKTWAFRAHMNFGENDPRVAHGQYSTTTNLGIISF